MATLRAVREALQTRLAAISGTGGGYALLDLNGADAFKVGHYSEPWLTSGQMACLWLLQVKRSPGPTLVGKSHDATFGLIVWIPVATDDPEVREDALEDAWADLTLCFRSATERHLGGIATETELSLDEHAGADVSHGADLCVLACTVTVTYREALP